MSVSIEKVAEVFQQEQRKPVELFQQEYEKQCERHGCEIIVNPGFTNDGRMDVQL